jgi:hypothetical protein
MKLHESGIENPRVNVHMNKGVTLCKICSIVSLKKAMI